jgi:hypothetical protein
MVKFLLAHGADPRKINAYQETPLAIAEHEEFEPIVTELKKALTMQTEAFGQH